jgi:hypothetical protein
MKAFHAHTNEKYGKNVIFTPPNAQNANITASFFLKKEPLDIENSNLDVRLLCRMVGDIIFVILSKYEGIPCTHAREIGGK